MTVLKRREQPFFKLFPIFLIMKFKTDYGAGPTRRQKFCKLGRISGKILVKQIFAPKFWLNAVALAIDNLIFYAKNVNQKVCPFQISISGRRITSPLL